MFLTYSPLMQHYCDVPESYCWSPTLLPCPADWPANAQVVGFCQLEASQRMRYQPPQDLQDFLAAGKAPVYIGFGSMTLSKAKVSPKSHHNCIDEERGKAGGGFRSTAFVHKSCIMLWVHIS